MRWGPSHIVEVPCTCGDITACRMERYVSDVRILEAKMREELIVAFVVGCLIGTVLGLGGLAAWFAVRWKWLY